MEIRSSSGFKQATSEAFLWTVWTEIAVLALLAVVSPALKPILFQIDLAQECLSFLTASVLPIFALFFLGAFLDRQK